MRGNFGFQEGDQNQMNTLGSKEKNRLWEEHLKAARAFPGPLREYCRVSGINYSKLQYWRGKLEGPTKIQAAVSSEKAVKLPLPFVRVEQEALQGTPMGALRHGAPGARFVAEVLWHMAMLGGVKP